MNMVGEWFFFLSFFDVHLHCVLADVRDAWGED
jgi:hypothetical protein